MAHNATPRNYLEPISGRFAHTALNDRAIDSGVLPFFEEPIYLSYADNTLSFDEPQPPI